MTHRRQEILNSRERMLEQTWRGAQVHGFGMEMRVCSLRRGRMTGCCTTLDATTWRGDEETARGGVVRGGGYAPCARWVRLGSTNYLLTYFRFAASPTLLLACTTRPLLPAFT